MADNISTGNKPVIRCVCRAQCKAGAEADAVGFFRDREQKIRRLIDDEQIMTLSVFKWDRQIFIYYECIGHTIEPWDIFGDSCGLLEKWPGEAEMRAFVPMMDIYHCCEPVEAAYWRRKQPVKKAYARVNKLRPEMVASYIFYHYQYQEEKPGDWGKYPSIHLHENLMFFYQEEPDGPDAPPYKGRLDTSNTPGEWEKLMKLHFLPWKDDPQQLNPWREIEQVLYLG